MAMISSPGIPPRGPAFPFPLMDNCIPSATPAGIFMVMTSSPRTMPSPLQDLHLSVITCPSPPQAGQVELVCMYPRMVCCVRVTCPVPLQVEQLLNPEPLLAPMPLHLSQETYLLTLTFFSTPVAISSSVSFTLMRRLEPRFTRLPLLRPPPPKKLSNGCSPPKTSPKRSKISFISNPPPPNPPPAALLPTPG